MASFFSSAFEAAALAVALSLDTFAAGLAYAGKGVKIPLRSAGLLVILCSAVPGLSVAAGAVLRPYLPQRQAAFLCFGILFVLGALKLAEGAIKAFASFLGSPLQNKRPPLLYGGRGLKEREEGKAGALSPARALFLAAALSLDGLSAGFGAALGAMSASELFLLCLLSNAAALYLGALAGRKIAEKTALNLPALGGALLILLAFTKMP